MSKKARITKKFRRRLMKELKESFQTKLEGAFSDYISYGVIIRKQYSDGTEERIIPIIEKLKI